MINSLSFRFFTRWRRHRRRRWHFLPHLKKTHILGTPIPHIYIWMGFIVTGIGNELPDSHSRSSASFQTTHTSHIVVCSWSRLHPAKVPTQAGVGIIRFIHIFLNHLVKSFSICIFICDRPNDWQMAFVWGFRERFIKIFHSIVADGARYEMNRYVHKYATLTKNVGNRSSVYWQIDEFMSAECTGSWICLVWFI